MNYIHALLHFHYVRIYNWIWESLGLPLSTKGNYHLKRQTPETLATIGWKPRSWGYDKDGVWGELTETIVPTKKTPIHTAKVSSGDTTHA